jgi:multiple sugar transport system permease protein
MTGVHKVLDAMAREPDRRFSELPGRFRKSLAGTVVTAITALVLVAFLLPLGYMAVTSLKSQAMIADPTAPIYPASPATFEYEGEQLDVYSVPIDGELQSLGMLKPGRQESQFIDPANPERGPVVWEGNWRLLDPAYEFDPQLQNFSEAWNTMQFPMLLRNTLIIAGFGTFGAVVSSIVVAYGLARFRVPLKRTIMVVLIATIILPRFVTLVPTYALFHRIGWVGTFLPLIVPHFFANAFNVFLLRQYFLTIPKELDEAATIDGAGSLRTLWSVVLPQMKPAIVAVCLFHFFFAWNDFFEPMVYLSARRDLQPISVGLQVFNSVYDSQPHLIQSGALIALFIPVIIFFFAQRVFLRGIDLSGVQK